MSAPISRQELDSVIARALAQYDEDVRAEWARIRIEPEKWRCKVSDDTTSEFWVIALEDGQVLWFNDVEEAFGWSRYSTRGTIDEYWTGTIDEYGSDYTEFSQVLDRIAQKHSDAARARVSESDVPASLVGPGTIVFRQSTYWEVRAASGAAYRIHFRQKVEFAFATAEYLKVELSDRHPLLAQYNEPLRSLYFSGTPLEPGVLVKKLALAIDDVSASWRGLQDYAGPAEALERLLRAGHGNLMNAPEAICSVAARVLEAEGVQSSILGNAAARPGKRVLLLGRSYVIASGFTFEGRNGT